MTGRNALPPRQSVSVTPGWMDQCCNMLWSMMLVLRVGTGHYALVLYKWDGENRMTSFEIQNKMSQSPKAPSLGWSHSVAISCKVPSLADQCSVARPNLWTSRNKCSPTRFVSVLLPPSTTTSAWPVLGVSRSWGSPDVTQRA